MKKIVITVILIALAVAFGPAAHQGVQDWRQADQARKRVEWMLRGWVAEDEQLALCQWSRGKVVMPMGDIEAALPDWQAFKRASGFGDARYWEVVAKRIVDERTTEITVAKGDQWRVLRVRDREPLTLAWDD